MSRYQDGLRRTLLDMHIGDWDPAFLSKYEPEHLAELYRRAGVTSAMLYCKSHLGLCYWPTSTGKVHANVGDRDLVGELVTALRARDIGPCAYHSIVFDNWAVGEHLEWRQVNIEGHDFHGFLKYAVCCQSNPHYRAYEEAQLTELVGRYDFDALFLDMIFWPQICACDCCRDRYRTETGAEIPETVDWTSPDWVRFQTAREAWASEFAGWLVGVVHQVRPDLPVTHNLSPALSNWVFGQNVLASEHDAFVAGDLYGDQVEQLVVAKLVQHLGQSQPAEFMTSRCVGLQDHEQLKSIETMTAQALAATANGSAFLFIDAVDPVGTVNEGVYERVGKVFERTSPYEPHIGGHPVEDVAVYYSVDSQMSFSENGMRVADVPGPGKKWPHQDAVRGAARCLQRAHIPFGVITRRELSRISDYRVVVLPNVSRMSPSEVEAFRGYVDAGGALYASRYTSLVDTEGTRHHDFQLGDVLGIRYVEEEPGDTVYLKPSSSVVAQVVSPQSYLSCPIADRRPLCALPRIAALPGAQALATLSLPYGYPQHGAAVNRNWSSIHSSPPWEDTESPTLVESTFGRGRTIYAVEDVERTSAEANEALFVALVRRLLGGAARMEVDTHPAVWAAAFDQRDRERVVVSLLNYPRDLPPSSVGATLRLAPPPGTGFTRLVDLPSETPIDFKVEGGVLTAQIDEVVDLVLLGADYARDSGRDRG